MKFKTKSILSALFGLLLIIGCASKKNLEDLDKVVPYNNKVIVSMKSDVTAADLEEKYKQYALKYKGLTSKSANKVMFEFDDTLISNGRMLALLNKDKMVLNAVNLKEASTKAKSGLSDKKGTTNPIK